MNGVLDEKLMYVFNVLKHGKQDVINFRFQKMSYIRFWPLFGIYRKVGDFPDIGNIGEQDIKLFLIMLQTIIDIVHVFNRKMEVNILNIHLFDVFDGEALILEFLDIKKRILDTFLILFDGLEISNGLVWVLQWVLSDKMKCMQCLWKE